MVREMRNEGGNGVAAVCDRFAELVRFSAETPGVSVSPSSLSVAPQQRDEFYDLVGAVQHALVEEVLQGSLQDAQRVARGLSNVRLQIVEGSDLNRLCMPEGIERFAEDAVGSFSKSAFSLVLDALQVGSGSDALIARARVELPGHAKMVMRCAYELWAYLGVVAALRPVEFREVFSPDTVQVSAMPTGTVALGAQVTSPERRMPEAVFKTNDGRCFAMKTELARELDHYGIKIRRRRDMSLGGNTADQTGHRVLLLYRVPNLDAVPLIADRDNLKVLASDLMVEVMLADEMDRDLSRALFVERINTLHSKRPVQVLTATDEGGFAPEMETDPGVAPYERRVVGFDEGALACVAALLDE